MPATETSASYLDTLTKSGEVEAGERTREARWRSLYLVRDALRGEVDDKGSSFRTSTCMGRLVDATNFVELMRSESRRKGRYGRDMRVCGSVWACPICSSNIAEHRRSEMARALAVAKDRGYFSALITRTVRHTSRDRLKPQLEAFRAAGKYMVGNPSYRALLGSLDAAGTVTVLEVTWGEASGWHTHSHALLFARQVDGPPATVARGFYREWATAAAKMGLQTTESAFNFQPTYGAVADYVAKWGRAPERQPWGTEEEMTKGGVKLARRGDRYSPFSLVPEHRERFLEYVRAFKGRRQLVWSPGLRADLIPTEEEKSDLELAMIPPRDYEPWGLLSKEELRAVDYSRLHHRLMTLVGRDDHAGAAALVNALRSRYGWLSASHDVGGAADLPATTVDALDDYNALPF